MALSEVVIRELRAELERLHDGKKRIDRQIEGIEIVLGHNNANGGDPARRRLAKVQDTGSARPTLRAAILKILGAMTSGMDAGEVTRQLSDARFEVGGTTSLRERAAHELRRLRIAGMIVRSRNRKYRLTPTAGATAHPQQVAVNAG